MRSLIRRLLGLRTARPSADTASERSLGDMTHDEARDYYEERRRDPAALDRRRNGPRQLHAALSTDAVCPTCGGSLGNRKPPQRRSSFKCKKCAAQLYADPKQELFASVYLTEKQKDLVDFLGQLDHWIYTAGTIHDFCWAKEQIGKADARVSDNVASDTIWFLLNYNLKNLSLINPGIDSIGMKTYREDLRGLIKEFREAQKEWSGQKRST